MSSIVVSAMREWRRSAARGIAASMEVKYGLQQRIERVMEIALGREMDRLERHMTFLASVGSAAPFIGLFGTVWGIMNAFTSIDAAKNTSLAVVAPGIARSEERRVGKERVRSCIFSGSLFYKKQKQTIK